MTPTARGIEQAAEFGLWWPDVRTEWEKAASRLRKRAQGREHRTAVDRAWRAANPGRQRENARVRRAANPEATRAKMRNDKAIIRARNRQLVLDWVAAQGRCAWAGCNYHIGPGDDIADLLSRSVVQRDHVDWTTVPRTSSGKRRHPYALTPAQLEADLANCQLLCTEHHLEKTKLDHDAGRC